MKPAIIKDSESPESHLSVAAINRHLRPIKKQSYQNEATFKLRSIEISCGNPSPEFNDTLNTKGEFNKK